MNQQWIADGIDGVMALALATGLFRSFVTIQAPTGTLGPSGAPTGSSTDVPGLVSIVCMDAPKFEANWRLSGEEMQRSDQVMSVSERHVLLDDYYPLLSQETNWGDVGWIAQLTDAGGRTSEYDIIGADADSQKKMTRLALQKASPGVS